VHRLPAEVVGTAYDRHAGWNGLLGSGVTIMGTLPVAGELFPMTLIETDVGESARSKVTFAAACPEIWVPGRQSPCSDTYYELVHSVDLGAPVHP
jgi:hypothetical protein